MKKEKINICLFVCRKSKRLMKMYTLYSEHEHTNAHSLCGCDNLYCIR